MVIIKVVAMFDDREALGNARARLLDCGLATEASIRTEPEMLAEPEQNPLPVTGWERLTSLFDTDADHDVSAYAEGLRRGSALLVVETPTEKAEDVKDVLREFGAIDLRRRVNRWITTGWQTFDPSALSFTELEILDERHACVSEAAITAAGVAAAGITAAGATAAGNTADGVDKTISLFDEGSGELVGRISEAELAVLRDALEEEGPDDDDYWINSEEVESIAALPGATAHLVALLRRAVGGRADGVDLRFEGAMPRSEDPALVQGSDA